MQLGKIEQVKEQPLTDEQLLATKQDIENLVKLICYIGKEHPSVETLANNIYDVWASK